MSIQARPDGTRRYQSALFAKKESYPGASDPEGVLLSAAARRGAARRSRSIRCPGRGGVSLAAQGQAGSEHTTTRMDIAPLVGRDDLLRTLLDVGARRRPTSGAPTISTLIGEPGYGKTHLAQMLAQNVESTARMETLFIRAKEALGGVPEQTTREILARLLALPERDAGRSRTGQADVDALGAELAREVWAGVAVAMGWAPPEHPELRELAAAPGRLALDGGARGRRGDAGPRRARGRWRW